MSVSTPSPSLQRPEAAAKSHEPGSSSARPAVVTICFALLGLVVAVYWPVGRFQFIHCDDPEYVWRNPHVQAGLTGAGLVWAFTASHAGNWHPITWLSHMLDCQLFDVNPGAHHVINLSLHAANVVLLFLLLRRLSGAFWRSALVAALFGLHPMHVESVAWISERKDVLSTLFFLLTIWAYAEYAVHRTQSSARVVRGWKFNVGSSTFELRFMERISASKLLRAGYFWYASALLFFALGLMSKPMLVTTPLVLLLLDYWPLNRILPSQNVQGEVSPINTPLQRGVAPDPLRGNRFNGFLQTAQTVETVSVPPKLGSTPLKRGVNEKSAPRCKPLLQLILEKAPFFTLSIISSILTLNSEQHGNALMPIASVPMDLRIENAALAYVSYLGKMFWPAKLAFPYPYPTNIRTELAAGAFLLIIALCAVAWAWRLKRPWFAVGWLWFLGTLFPVIGLVQAGNQAMADRYSYIPFIGAFIALAWGAEELSSRSRSYRIAAASAAGVLLVLCAGLTAIQVRFWQNSETLFRHSIAVTTRNSSAQMNLGAALAEEGKLDEAAQCFNEALRISPNYAEAQSNLGFVLAAQGKWSDAIAAYRAALANNPRISQIHYLLGSALLAQHKVDEAIPEYQTALELDPEHQLALNDLAWVFATASEPRFRDGARAVSLAERACRLTNFQAPQYIGTLAAAYAEAGRFDDAVKSADLARNLAERVGDHGLAEKNDQLLLLYRQGRSFHER